jgi:hypothetical protein
MPVERLRANIIGQHESLAPSPLQLRPRADTAAAIHIQAGKVINVGTTNQQF